MLYIMQVLTGKEAPVMHMMDAQLLKTGEQIFSPTFERKKRIHGKDQIILSRMFPGYLFIETSDATNLFIRIQLVKDKHFLETLTKLLRNDDFMLPVSKEEADSLYSLLQISDTIHDIEKGISISAVHHSEDSKKTVLSQNVNGPEYDESDTFDVGHPITTYTMSMSHGVIRKGKLTVVTGSLVGKETNIIRVNRHKKLAILSIKLLGRNIEMKAGLEITEKD